jgi:hypothetical protein
LDFVRCVTTALKLHALLIPTYLAYLAADFQVKFKHTDCAGVIISSNFALFANKLSHFEIKLNVLLLYVHKFASLNNRLV